MSISRGVGLGAALAGLLWIGTGLYSCGAQRARDAAAERIRSADLRADSIAAAADTTRVIYRDSLQLVTRRAVQAEVEKDRIDRALGLERRVTSTLSLVIDSLRTQRYAAVDVDSADARHASWHVREEPWTADIEVVLPTPPDSATLRLALALDPVGVTVRVGCGRAPAGGGVRPAEVAVEGPLWARLELSGVVLDPEVCSPAFAAPRGPSRSRWFAAGAIAGAAGVLWLLR